MVQSAAQKPQSPPPPPKQPDAQPTASKVSSPATQTGFSKQDGFEAQSKDVAPTAPKAQGDAFEAPQVKPVTLAPTAPPADAKVVDAQATAATEPATAPDPNAPTTGMTEDELKAYNALSPTERPRYDALHQEALQNTQGNPEGDSPLATPEKSVDELRDLLLSGQMGDFLKVEDALGGQAGDQAHTDLHQLVFRGVLPGTPDINGDTMLATLAHLGDAGTQLLPNVDRQGLLGDLLHDLNHHELIEQLPTTPTCSGADAAWYMALNQPAEYVRQVSQMAEHGEVQLQPDVADRLRAMGLPIPESDVRSFQGAFDPTQNATEQIFQTGFTDAAQDERGEGGFFNELFDKLQQVTGTDEGVTAFQHCEELNQNWGGPDFEPYFLPPAGDQSISQEVRDQARSTTEDMLATASPAHPVFINLDGHFVAVTDYDRTTGQLDYFDSQVPYDQRPPLTLDDVMEKGSSVCYQPSYTKVEVPAELTAHPEWDDEGGGGSGAGGFGSGGGGSGTSTRPTTNVAQ